MDHPTTQEAVFKMTHAEVHSVTRMERKLPHIWVVPLLLVIQHGAVAIPLKMIWGQGFPWTAARPHSVHPFLHWSMFHQLPSSALSVQPPLITTLSPNWNMNRAENRLFPSAYGKTDPYIRAEHRLFPSHPSQDILATRPEHRSIVAPNVPIEVLESLANKTMKDSSKNTTKPHRKMSKRHASTSEPSAVIFPETSQVEHPPNPIEPLPEATLGIQKTSDVAEDKKISAGGKFVLDGLSLIAGSIFGGGPMSHHYSPLLASSAGFFPPPPLHPPYPPFLFPGPSAIYPNFVPPYHPMAMGHQSYFPEASSNPYQPMSVDSLLVPLVGLVGLSLLVPDIIKTKREGRPSDLGGLDVFRYLNEDEHCLKRLACEAGVTISDNDDSVTIQRALERALAAKRLIPDQQIGSQIPKPKPQCGQHSCASWITESADSTSVTNGR